MADRVSLPTLKKEVLAPYKESSGLGVVIVASMAMFFAVASSALALRARMARQCAPSSVPVMATQPIVVDWMLPAQAADPILAPMQDQGPAAEPRCGEPYYHPNADGSVSVFFTVCPDAERPDLGVIRSAPVPPMSERPGPGGIEVNVR